MLEQGPSHLDLYQHLPVPAMKKRPSPVSQHLLCQNLPSSAAAIGGERGDDRRQLLSSPRHRLLEAHQEALAARRSVNCLKPKVFVFRRHWGGAIGMAVRTRLEGLGPKLRSKNWSRRMPSASQKCQASYVFWMCEQSKLMSLQTPRYRRRSEC